MDLGLSELAQKYVKAIPLSFTQIAKYTSPYLSPQWNKISTFADENSTYYTF